LLLHRARICASMCLKSLFAALGRKFKCIDTFVMMFRSQNDTG
jgi:hypothetical protein